LYPTVEQILEWMLIAVWFIFGWVDTSFSFSSGAIIFYLIQIDRKKQNFSIGYFTVLLFVSIVFGHYVYELIPLLIKQKYLDAVPAINFMIGLFSKLTLDIILTKEFVKGKIK